MIQKFSEEEIEKDEGNGKGQNIVKLAIEREEARVLEVLYEKEKDLFKEEGLLNYAVEREKVEAIYFLIKEVGLNVNIEYRGKRAIDIAVEKKSLNIIYMLLTNGTVLSEKLESIALMLRKERGKRIYKELLKMTVIGSEEMLEVIMKGVEEVEQV